MLGQVPQPLHLPFLTNAPRRQGRGARAPHLYLYTPADLPCYIPLRASRARKPMLRHALVPRVSASLHRLALTYNLKPVVDPLLLQNLPPWPFRPLHDSLRQQWRCCRQPYRLLLPDCRRLLDGRSSPHSQRRLFEFLSHPPAPSRGSGVPSAPVLCLLFGFGLAGGLPPRLLPALLE